MWPFLKMVNLTNSFSFSYHWKNIFFLFFPVLTEQCIKQGKLTNWRTTLGYIGLLRRQIGCYNSLLQTHLQQIGCSDCWGWFNFLHRLDSIFELVYFRNQKMVNLQYRIFTSEIDITSVAAAHGPTPMFILWLQLSATCHYLTWFNPWYHDTTLLEIHFNFK